MRLLMTPLQSLYVLTALWLVGFVVPVSADTPGIEVAGDTQPAVFVARDTEHATPVRLASFRLRLQEIPPRPNHVWRKTAGGWQQIPVESTELVHVLELPHERPRIHPFSVASLTLLLALAAMAWASSEWDWCRLVGEDW